MDLRRRAVRLPQIFCSMRIVPRGRARSVREALVALPVCATAARRRQHKRPRATRYASLVPSFASLKGLFCSRGGAVVLTTSESAALLQSG